MIFFNQIINAKGTPSIYEDTLANRPAASSLGRLFVQTDNPYGIYRDQGTSWQLITGSGGGGSQNWDQVLALAGSFTDNREANLDSYGLLFNNIGNITYKFSNTNYLNLDSTSFNFYDQNAGTTNGFYFRYNFGYSAYLGDFQGLGNYTSFSLDDNSQIFYTSGHHLDTMGLFFDFYSNIFTIGDPNEYINGTKNIVDVQNNKIYSYSTGTGVFGYEVRFNNNTIKLGDVSNNTNGTQIVINNTYLTDNIYTLSDNKKIGYNFYYDDFNAQLTFGGVDSYFSIPYTLYKQNYFELNSYLNTGTQDNFGLLIDYRGTNTGDGLMQLGNYSSSFYAMRLDIGYSNSTPSNNYLKTNFHGQMFGINIQPVFNTVEIGDTGYVYGASGSYLSIGGNNFQLVRVNNIYLNGTGIISSTSGSTSSQHLVVYINGTQYKIQLRNP